MLGRKGGGGIGRGAFRGGNEVLVSSTHAFDMLIATLSKRFVNAATPSATLIPDSLPYRCVATCLDASVENWPGPTFALGGGGGFILAVPLKVEVISQTLRPFIDLEFMNRVSDVLGTEATYPPPPTVVS